MALNVNTLITRSTSASVFVIVLLGSILWSYISFSVLFLVVSIIALHEFYNIAQKLGSAPYRKTGFVCAAFVYLVFSNGFLIKPESIFEVINFFKPAIVLVPLIIFLMAIYDKEKQSVLNCAYTILGIVYAVIPFVLLNQIVGFKNESNTLAYNPHLILGVIFLIWANDTFAYLGGSLFGKNKMIERVSPGKTWEGTVFGIVVAFGISFSFKYFLNIPFTWIWPFLGIAVPILATLGDLVESQLKRQAGIKDSGQIMPGHGGALDRFDSLIFVSPFVYAITQLL